MPSDDIVEVRPGLRFTIQCEVDRESMVVKGRWVIDNELGVDLYLDEQQIQQAFHKRLNM